MLRDTAKGEVGEVPSKGSTGWGLVPKSRPRLQAPSLLTHHLLSTPEPHLHPHSTPDSTPTCLPCTPRSHTRSQGPPHCPPADTRDRNQDCPLLHTPHPGGPSTTKVSARRAPGPQVLPTHLPAWLLHPATLSSHQTVA